VDYDQQCLSIAKGVGDEAMQARVYGNIGAVHHFLGDLKTAMEYHQQRLRTVLPRTLEIKESKDGYIVILVHFVTLLVRGLKTAVEYCQQCLSIFKDVENKVQQRLYIVIWELCIPIKVI